MYQVQAEQIQAEDIFYQLLQEQTSQNHETGSAPALYQNIESKRNTNTIDKIGRLRVRRELIIIAKEQEKKDKEKKGVKSQAIKRKLQQIFEETNNSASFGKMIVLAQKQFLITSLKEKWPKICDKFLAKKKQKMKGDAERYELLKESFSRITACLQLEELSDIQLVASIYWGDFRQKTKFNNCVTSIRDYDRDYDQNEK